ncbi:MarR family winged helix-turn-helix transcriptional regulator [Corynebacterium aquatimens]|uniref:DNA-binding MarR family transcriptional regulator n=1 Tax=Corynebacterium aquatimens TaxID=1190508 RepID=A0A931E2V4_9CORY|nr:MarR family transcriptional regulator [Corynebacterium aquatimens]MBG6122781.1 DNA-binding MarR family transcriptional regulator [Corynebacterium aquatimens]
MAQNSQKSSVEKNEPHTPDELARAIRPFLTKLYVAYFRISQTSDITGPQLSILERLNAAGPMRISQLAQEEGIRMPTASNTLHQLEERNLVARVRDEQDRRGVTVELTDFGREELERVANERTKYVAEMLSTIDPELLSSRERTQGVVDILGALAESYATDNVVS